MRKVIIVRQKELQKKQVCTYYLPMRKICIYMVLAALSLFCISCGKSYTLERGFEPARTILIEKTPQGGALVRALFGDVVMRELSNDDFEKLLSSSFFLRKPKKGDPKQEKVPFRIPPYVFFETVIINDLESPIVLKSIVLRYKNEDHPAFTVEQIKKQCTSPAYAKFNFDTLLSPFRLLGDSRTVKQIDFKQDLILCKLPYVAPSEKIYCIYAFDWVAAEVETVNVVMKFSTGDGEKTVDFDFIRPAYRTRGKYFTKPAVLKENEL